MTCIPCAYKKLLEESKLNFLRKTAKARAVESGSFYAIVFDEEDKRYIIKEYESAKVTSESTITEVISPY